MGELLQAHCSCGYTSRDLAVGVGMLRRHFSPAHCHHCRETVAVEAKQSRLRCSRCGRKVALLELADAGIAEDAVHWCPRCGELRLRFAGMGLWD